MQSDQTEPAVPQHYTRHVHVGFNVQDSPPMIVIHAAGDTSTQRLLSDRRRVADLPHTPLDPHEHPEIAF